jgi:hypothetical protein
MDRDYLDGTSAMNRTGRFLRGYQFGCADGRCGSDVERIHGLNAVCRSLAHRDFCDVS